MNPSLVELVGAVLFAVAILHTFTSFVFDRLAARSRHHAGIFHLLGEVEVVFGFWAMVLVVFMAFAAGKDEAVHYVDSRNFTEPLFVFAIMVIAATRPVLYTAGRLVDSLAHGLARVFPLPGAMSFCWVVLVVVPLLGSFITEPAAMTLAAMILGDRLLSQPTSQKLRYAVLGTLFVNISVGGTLTHFAAPPVLMVASTWNWDLAYMFTHFGWKAALACMISATLLVFFFRRDLAMLRVDSPDAQAEGSAARVPVALIVVHLLFLAGLVAFAHHAAIFMGLLLFFLGVHSAYPQHQDRLILREALLVAFFLAGLVVLGGLQRWWLQPLLMSMSESAVFAGATALTAVTDNAALTYLGSLVEGLSDEFKYALVSGAVTGGGLTIIANAPNPAGISILRKHFDDQAENPLKLLLAALGPTIISALCFRLL